MAKLITSPALIICVLLVIIANASSAYRTIVTTVEIDEPNPRGKESQRCRQEVQRQDLSACENYIRQSRKSEPEPVEEVLAMRGIENQQQILRQCCNQVKQLRDDCQCEGIRSVLERQLGRGQVTTKEEYESIMRRASNLPSACGLRQSCQIRSD